MIGQNQVRAVAHSQARGGVDPSFRHGVELAHQRLEVHHDAVPNHRDLVRPQDAARQELEDKFSVVNYHRMAGVGAALVARHDVKMFGKGVYHFPLTLITPLDTDNHDASGCLHELPFRPGSIYRDTLTAAPELAERRGSAMNSGHPAPAPVGTQAITRREPACPRSEQRASADLRDAR